MDECEVAVVGAGVVGLAVARELALAGHEVIVLERHADIATEISARNSEVIHAGLYYPTGSLKARLCVEGRDALYRYCDERGIPHRRCGKLLVANGAEQERKLAAIAAQAARNGVLVESLRSADAAVLEPSVRCTAALHSPLTGVLDSRLYALSLLGDLEAAGGILARQSTLECAHAGRGRIELVVAAGDGGDSRVEQRLLVRWLINCAGLSAPDVAGRIAGLDCRHVPTAYFAKGNYFAYSGRVPFQRLVYPMPDEAGLGIHATIDLGGQVKFGPDVEWVERPDYRVDERRAPAFYAAVREYWPGIEEGRLVPGYAGVRPKIVGPGASASDFVIAGPQAHGISGLVNLFGIESPGLTASLALGRFVRTLVS